MATITRTDVGIQRDVMDEFIWDPEVLVTDVGVEVDDGVVTLTGTVKQYVTKRAAERSAFRVAGVRAVANDIEVHSVWEDERTDTDIAKAAANVLQYSSTAPHDAIHIRVAKHWITLSGEVPWDYQRLAVEKAMNHLSGVVGVTNLITVKQPMASAFDVKDGIERAFVRSAEVDADHITVDVDGGHVTLTGTVRSWSERQEAQSAAWKSHGVMTVTNKLEIRPT